MTNANEYPVSREQWFSLSMPADQLEAGWKRYTAWFDRDRLLKRHGINVAPATADAVLVEVDTAVCPARILQNLQDRTTDGRNYRFPLGWGHHRLDSLAKLQERVEQHFFVLVADYFQLCRECGSECSENTHACDEYCRGWEEAKAGTYDPDESCPCYHDGASDRGSLASEEAMR